MAKFKRLKLTTKWQMYFVYNLRAAIFSLGKILRTPWTSLITIAVIGVVLSLPTTLYVLLANLQTLGKSWDNQSSQISLYLKTDVTATQLQDLIQQLKINPELVNVEYISPAQGLKEFLAITGAEKVLNSLSNNPLPGVILVQPILSLRSPATINKVINALQQLPEVTSVQLDLQWLERLAAIINLIKHGILALTFLLSMGVLLTVGNTMRLVTQSERRGILVQKLVGATNAFVRRPFIYAGLWYGFFGGILAWILVVLIISWLQTPVNQLATAYHADFSLQSLSLCYGIKLLFLSMLLGFLGSWLAAAHSLRKYY